MAARSNYGIGQSHAAYGAFKHVKQVIRFDFYFID